MLRVWKRWRDGVSEYAGAWMEFDQHAVEEECVEEDPTLIPEGKRTSAPRNDKFQLSCRLEGRTNIL